MKKSKAKIWASIIFGVYFILLGIIGSFWPVAKMTHGYVSSANWVDVPAKIHSLKLDGQIVKATYTYSFNQVDYKSGRVGLQKSGDNIGPYWKNLYTRLQTTKQHNEVLALVDPHNPDQSILDRTFRWGIVAFSFFMSSIFTSIGIFFLWRTIRKEKPIVERIKDEQANGIPCKEKLVSTILAWGACALSIYFGVIYALSINLFFGMLIPVSVFTIAYFALKRWRKQLGHTPLFLAPAAPEVGGQLGGHFSISLTDIANAIDSSTTVYAVLSCRSNRNKTVRWQTTAPIYLEQIATGIKASFLFEIPQDQEPTAALHSSSTTKWEVRIDWDLTQHGLKKISRSWDVVVAANSQQQTLTSDHSPMPLDHPVTPDPVKLNGLPRSGNVVGIPQSFLAKHEKKSEERVRTSALEQISISEDDQTAHFNSDATRQSGTAWIAAALFGIVFIAIGLFVVSNGHQPGYVFAFIGLLFFVFSVFFKGVSLQIEVDKASNTVLRRYRWFGHTYSQRKAELNAAHQLSIKLTMSQTQGTERTEFYAVMMHDNHTGKQFRVAQGIKGKHEAEVIKQSILDVCITDHKRTLAA